MPAASPTSAPAPTFLALWRQFLPLSVSDVTMAGSEPLVATTLAHLPDPRVHLAALGVAKAIAIFLESPIIMVLHAANALAGSSPARVALRHLVVWLSAGLTLALALLAVPPVFGWVAARLFGVAAPVEAAAHAALCLLLLWPAAIGWRRYVQGLLIAAGHGGVVGRAGLGRITVVAIGLGLGFQAGWPGASVGASALVAGVTAEAVFVTLGAWRRGVFVLPAGPPDPALPHDVPGVWRYYRPLASSMLVVWGGRAAMIAIVARAADAPVALAAWPAAWSLVTVIANATRMVQQLTIRHEASTPLPRLLAFAASVGATCSALVLLLAATPWGHAGLAAFLGHDASLIAAARPTVLACAAIPLLVALQNASQGLLIARGATWAVSRGAWVGVGSGLACAAVAVAGGAPGAAAAATSMALGYALELGALWLVWKISLGERRV
ncbi:MAG: hypothetical protein VKS61_16890 [Candidatus Sericytochromatia bacterium]|nr:hypothetical protein [Candidatus Sericytochromatia bacterium]